MRTVYITEKQFNKMGLPKKVRQNLIPYGDGEGGCDAGGDVGMAAGMAGGGVCESKTPILKFYRGYKKRFGPWRDHLFWLTDNPSYAKEYGDTVAEVSIDSRRLKSTAMSDIGCDDDFDYYDGPSEQQCAELLKNGINCYHFYTDDMGAEIMCLWDKNAIVGFRVMTKEEVEEIAPYNDEFINEIFGKKGNLLIEALDPNFDLMPYINSFNDFLIREGYPVKPLPKLNLDNGDQNDVMIKTGFYLPDEKSITLFVKDRHPKDILRSYAHEMTHHIQNMEDPNRDWGSGKDLKEDDVLSEIEADAYERGNILFRKWTEELKKQPDNRLNEGLAPREISRKLEKLKARRGPDNIEDWNLLEATESDVDLSSFKVKDELNPKIWKDGKLDSRVRLTLMDIADDFYDTLGISWVKPEDTIIVGSIANYNWSEYSDIDLHLVIDYDKVDKRTKFVEEFFKSKKKEWNTEHSDIRIFGFPVEVYVQDSKADAASSGVYSIDKNDWIKKPVKGVFSKKDIDVSFIKKKAASLMTDIENLEDESRKSGDSYSDKKVFDKTGALIDKIMSTRREKLSTTKNEMNPDNLVFKTLRRNGYLDRLFSLNGKSYDKTKSIK